MRRRLAVLALAVPLLAAGPPAGDAEAGFAAILDLCTATTLGEAAERGRRLGWPDAPADRLARWRADFERHNGGTVQVVGWRRGEREGDGLLSFWVAKGPNAHVACALSTDRPGLIEVLRRRFGEPDEAEQHGDVESASWRRGGAELSFTRVGASTGLNLSRRG